MLRKVSGSVRVATKFFYRASVLLALALLVVAGWVLVWLNTHELPDDWKRLVVRELEARGFYAEVGQLALDWRGAVVARNLVLYRGPDHVETWIKVNRARIGFAWLSWWRGQPFIRAISIAGATLDWRPSTGAESVQLADVYGHVTLEKQIVRVRSLRARLLDLELTLSGVIRVNGWVAKEGPTAEEAVRREENVQRQVRMALEQVRALKVSTPIQLQLVFDGQTRTPELGQITLRAQGRNFSWRGMPVAGFALEAQSENGDVRLKGLRVRLRNEELVVKGEMGWKERRAQLEFQSRVLPADFAPLVPASVRSGLKRLRFSRSAPPLASGRLSLDWTEVGQPLRWNLDADLDWSSFAYGRQRFTRMRVPIAFDGRRLLIPDFQLEHPSGKIQADVFWEADKSLVRARLNSDIDPTVFMGMFGLGLDPFLKSCKFEKGGPHVRAEISASTLEASPFQARGRLEVERFVYKGVRMESAATDFDFSSGKLQLPNFLVKRKEGEAHGALVYDFPGKRVTLQNVEGNLHVQEIAPALGPKFTEYVRPYPMDKPAAVKVSGVVDLDESTPTSITDLDIAVDAKSTRSTLTWRFLTVPWKVRSAVAKILVVGKKLTLDLPEADLLEGKLEAKVNVMLQKPARYSATAQFSKINFGGLMETAFQSQQARGVLDGTVEASGEVEDLASVKGAGQVIVTDGYITSIPIFGGLSKFVGAIIPDFGFAKADKAISNFALADGRVRMDSLEISSATFVLIGHGDYDYIKDDLDLKMRVNARGLPGIFLYGMSKLFEYRGQGSIREPRWEPRNF